MLESGCAQNMFVTDICTCNELDVYNHCVCFFFLATRYWSAECIPCRGGHISGILCLGALDNSNASGKYRSSAVALVLRNVNLLISRELGFNLLYINAYLITSIPEV